MPVHHAADGTRYGYTRTGRGAPVLLLHGFTGSAESWHALGSALAPTHDVVAVDLLGHGASDAPSDPARHALPRAAADISALLDALGVAPATVVGYSMGGRVALRLALDRPATVRTLVLESTSAGIADTAARAERRAADAALADAIERDGVPAFVDRWERLPLWASQAQLPAATRAAQRAQRLRNRAVGLAASLRGAGAGVDPPVLDRLAALAVPTMLVVGALDPAYVAHAQAMAEWLPDARVRIVPGAGHAVHLERPDVVHECVREMAGDRGPGTGDRGPEAGGDEMRSER